MSIRNVPTEVVWTIIAVAGGVAKHLSGAVARKEPWRPLILIAKAFISAFSGYMFAKTCTLLVSSQDWSTVAAGVGGYLGTEGVEYIVTIFRAKLDGKSGPSIS